MYLYFNRAGVLKEVINNQPARSTAANVNKLYVYVEGMEEDGAERLWVRYQYNTDQYTAETEVTTRLTGTNKIEIPFNKERDLKYFKYFTKYEFFVATVPDAVLQVNGNVLATFRMVIDGPDANTTVTDIDQIDETDPTRDIILPLGLVTFDVEYTTGQLGNGTIEYDGYVSIAQFNYLVSLFSGIEDNTDTKVDKTSTANQVYATDNSGNQTTIGYSTSPSTGKIVQRSSNGDIQVPNTPGSDSMATSRYYVNTTFVNLASTQAITGQKTFSGKAIFSDANLYNGYLTTNSKNYFTRVGVTTNQYVTYKLPYNYSDVGAQTYTLITKEYVDARIEALGDVFNYRGSKTVAEINALPDSTFTAGDVYNVSDGGTLTLGNVDVLAGDNVVWDGTAWDKLASTIDLSGYVQKTELLASDQDIQDIMEA